EIAEQLVVRGQFAFPVEDADGDGLLVLLGGREDLALPRRYRRLAGAQTGKDTAKRFNTERQRGDVEQQNVLDVPLQNAGLNCGADGDNLVRVDTLMRLAAKEGFNFLDDLRHTAHTADENNLVDL